MSASASVSASASRYTTAGPGKWGTSGSLREEDALPRSWISEARGAVERGIGRAGTKPGPSLDAGLRRRLVGAGPAIGRRAAATLRWVNEIRIWIWPCVDCTRPTTGMRCGYVTCQYLGARSADTSVVPDDLPTPRRSLASQSGSRRVIYCLLAEGYAAKTPEKKPFPTTGTSGSSLSYVLLFNLSIWL